MTKSEFIAEVTEGLLPPPVYFPLNVKMNREGYEHIDTILRLFNLLYPPTISYALIPLLI